MATNSTAFKVDGFDDLAKVWKQLPNQIKDKEVQRFLIQSGKPIQRAAKSLVGEKTGNLKKAIRFKRGKRKANAIDVWLGVQNRRRKAGHWHLVTFGTKERKIDSYKTKASTREKLVANEAGEMGLKVNLQGRTYFITHTGKMTANPFMTKAQNQVGLSTSKRQQKLMARYVTRSIKRLNTKYGL
jgi:hypothetical protein